jgi:hypothetical protein
MGFKTGMHRWISPLLRRFGVEVVPSARLYEWQKGPPTGSSHNAAELPAGAEQYLRLDNPRLAELRTRYAASPAEVTASPLWKDDYVTPEQIRFFRGDNPYVWQLRGENNNVLGYALARYYLLTIDELGLLDKLDEDDAFGSFSFVIGGKRVSRDLLDSINEISFLERHLGLSTLDDCPILDIGAGYGRLAHRLLTAFPNVREYYCTDAVPISTFISEYYLRYRGLQDRAHVVPLDEIETTLQERRPRIAVNIHSFSECSVAAIDWWVALLARSGVRHLLVVPNSAGQNGEVMLTNDGHEISPIVARHGYGLVVAEPKYLDPVVQTYALNPTFYYLFELANR